MQTTKCIAEQSEKLYDRDFVAWCEDTVAKLQSRNLEELDFENLIEEIDALGKSQRRELRNRLKQIFIHLLKRVYVDSDYDNSHWEDEIAEQQDQLRLLLKESPSLKPSFTAYIDECYPEALKRVRKKYGRVHFPDTCPFPNDAIALLVDEFWKAEDSQ